MHKDTPFCAKLFVNRHFSLRKSQKSKEILAEIKKKPLLCSVKTIL